MLLETSFFSDFVHFIYEKNVFVLMEIVFAHHHDRKNNISTYKFSSCSSTLANFISS